MASILFRESLVLHGFGRVIMTTPIGVGFGWDGKLMLSL